MNEQHLAAGQLRPIYETGYAPLTSEDLAALRERGITLPETYAAFVAKYGQSHFGKWVVVRPIDKVPGSLDDGGLLFGLFLGGATAKGSYSLLWNVRVYHDDERVPRDLLPIAAHHGDLYCLGLSGPRTGQVYLWDGATEMDVYEYEDWIEDENAVYDPYHNVYLVAESFEDFIERLEFSDEPED